MSLANFLVWLGSTNIEHQVRKATLEDCRKVRTMPSLVLVTVASAFEAFRQVSS
jgi:hypothetical protein